MKKLTVENLKDTSYEAKCTESNLLNTRIAEAVAYAREKHPVWPENSFEQLAVVTEELGEIAQAINDQDLEKATYEAYQTIATLIRFLEGK